MATPQAMNRSEPKGGVMVPMHIQTTNTTPKWTGSMPMAVAAGAKMGVRITRAGETDMNIPRKNIKMLNRP